MAICFEKLASLGVLMVGELDSTLICHPGFSCQESANHQGLDVKHFECFRIDVPSATRCLGFPVPGPVSPEILEEIVASKVPVFVLPLHLPHRLGDPSGFFLAPFLLIISHLFS